jgi:hypothetical protein
MIKELLSLAATVVEASGATEHGRSATRAVAVMVTTAVVSLCAVGCLVCLLTALWLYEEPLIGEVGAPLVVAAVLAAIAVIAGLVLHAKTKAPPASPPAPVGLTGLGAAVDVAQGLMKSNKFLVLLGAVMIGLAAGEGQRR